MAVGIHRVSSSLLGPVDPSFRALAGRLEFMVRRHKFNKDPLSSWKQAAGARKMAERAACCFSIARQPCSVYDGASTVCDGRGMMEPRCLIMMVPRFLIMIVPRFLVAVECL